jgi:geranylgeranyl diphosphate synthase, type II
MHHYFEKFEAYRQARPFAGTPTELYEPVNYIMELGGKRMRPILALMGYHLFEEDYSPALPLAYALEIFHNFSLVHDDIMDAAPLRRNQQTVHIKWNTNLAILAGDVMLIQAYEYLLQFTEKERIVSIASVFNRVAREVCEGQQMDMNFESRKDVSIPEYIRMIELKTSVLVGGALEMAGLAAGAAAADVQRLYHFGRNIGIAFQIQDDLLDAFGEKAEVGKQIGGDILQNKKTWLILRALELASVEVRQRLETLMNRTSDDPDQKILEVKAILEYLNVPALAEAAKAEYQKAAFEQLEAIEVHAERKKALTLLAESLFSRKS